MTTHLSWELLNDLAGAAPEQTTAPTTTPTTAPTTAPTANSAPSPAALHLAECERCRQALISLQAVDAAARTLPTSEEPPEALWRAVSTTISQRTGARAAAPGAPPNVASPRVASPRVASPRLASPRVALSPVEPPRARRLVLDARWLAAAALLLMALTASGTAWVLRRDVAPAVASGGGSSAAAIPASFAATERAYLDNVAELQALLDTQRPRLAPATIAVVERALEIIDAAIAEARAALITDPANQELAELLAASYRQKVDLLRRAAEVPGAT